MNREIKFRVFHPESQKFVYWTLEEGFNYSDRYLSQYEYPVQQYTGLKDKNGKEIFEGDILTVADKYNLTVEWFEKNACWGVSSGLAFAEFEDEMTVIGNIFENPELLK